MAWVVPGFDLIRWWLDVWPLPALVGTSLSVALGALLVAWSLRPGIAGPRWRAMQGVLGLILAATVWDAVSFFALLALDRIESRFPVPLSLLAGALLLFLYRTMAAWGKPPISGATGRVPAPSAGASQRSRLLLWSTVGLVVLMPLLFPLAQMFCFGKTDYRRPAQVAVVLGAAVWPGNRPSHALLDRVNTGIDLYRQGLVDVLLFSGGPSDDESISHETVVMHDLAVAAGVPEEAIWLDPLGIDTQSTVDNTVAMFRERGILRVLAVSHFYHLPRIHMTYQRAGFPVYTVPAREEHILLKLPFFLAREAVALWFYYFRPLME